MELAVQNPLLSNEFASKNIGRKNKIHVSKIAQDEMKYFRLLIRLLKGCNIVRYRSNDIITKIQHEARGRTKSINGRPYLHMNSPRNQILPVG